MNERKKGKRFGEKFIVKYLYFVSYNNYKFYLNLLFPRL